MDRRTFTLEYHLVDSCNLKCAGCSHYSSLLDTDTYPSKESVIDDLSFLKSKIGDNLSNLRLLGGEPLMHPQICECLEGIRGLFPNTNISIVTNGLLLEKMQDEFYDICSKGKITVRITDYGIIDFESAVKRLRDRGVQANKYRTSNVWRYKQIRLTEGKTDCLKGCAFKRMCNNYRNGKIYLCPHIAYIEYFNKCFGKDIKLNETDYISLDDVSSFDDLMDRIGSANPNFCSQYCNCQPLNGKWMRTKKDIGEFCLL